jgi:hypothetical protein
MTANMGWRLLLKSENKLKWKKEDLKDLIENKISEGLINKKRIAVP